ncbi:MAG TPA: hypothetical protein VFB41_09840 [Solirubrobacteraceae bacterium]|nr:hypothetical protein [Solirubrobacteraceae bacterium]
MLAATTPPTPPVNPCTVPAKHLKCPDWVMSEPTEFHVRSVGKRTILMMQNTLVNVGSGPVEFRGRRLSEYEMTARQIVERTGGRSRVALRTGARLHYTYVDKTRGSYWKFSHAARFELWRLDGQGRRVERVRIGPKLDYCNRDLRRVGNYPGSPLTRHYPACPQQEDLQTATIGTSIGWVDSYPWVYPNNWVEVTGQKGCFVVIHRADPNDTVREEREDNNTSSKVIRLPFRHGVQTCPRFDPTTPPTATADPLPPEPEPVQPTTTTPTPTYFTASGWLRPAGFGSIPKL